MYILENLNLSGDTDMLLVADAGNTSIHLAAFKEDEIVAEYRIVNDDKKSANEYSKELRNFIKKENLSDEFNSAIISSVVPAITHPLENAIKDSFNVEAKIVDPDKIDIGITIKTGNPKELGADRIVNSYAGYKMYGGPCVIVDAGTATTFEVINKDAEFIGGVISPGVKISLDALSNLTALLPKVDVKEPAEIISTTTEGNMLAGGVAGHAAMIEGIVTRIENELGKPVEKVITGGYSQTLADCMLDSSDFNLEPNLTLKGLKLLNDLNEGKKKGANLAP